MALPRMELKWFMQLPPQQDPNSPSSGEDPLVQAITPWRAEHIIRGCCSFVPLQGYPLWALNRQQTCWQPSGTIIPVKMAPNTVLNRISYETELLKSMKMKDLPGTVHPGYGMTVL